MDPLIKTLITWAVVVFVLFMIGIEVRKVIKENIKPKTEEELKNE